MDFRLKEIISHLFASDQKMMDFLFEPTIMPRLREHPGILADESWEFAPESQALVRAALDIWNGSGNAFLWELLKELSDDNFCRLTDAMRECRKLEQEFESSKWSFKHG